MAIRAARAAIPLLASAALFGQQTAFEGIASNAITHEPLSGVHIRLVGIRNLPQGQFDSYGATTDRAGHFSIAPLPPGAYIFLPQRAGFVYGQRKDGSVPLPSLTFKAGEQLTGFKLEMTPEGIIQGRILDDFGDPVEHAQVTAVAQSNDFVWAGAGTLGENAPAAESDDRGMFQLAVLPGKYYIQANPRSNSSNGVPAQYAVTWFPQAPAKESAAVVEARAAAETTGIEIRLGHKTTLQRPLTISGSVTGVAPGETQTIAILQSGPSAQRMNSSRSMTVNRDGRFTFSGLEPGFYRLSAMQSPNGSGGMRQGPAVELQLTNTDVTNLELQLTSGGDLSGTVEIEGDPPGAPQEKRSIHLRAIGSFSFGGPPSADLDRDGSFHIASVAAGRFQVQVDPIPEGAFIKSMVLDGVAAARGILELRGAPGARVKIVIGRKGARLSGRVRDAAGEPLVNTLAIVVLVDDIQNINLDNQDQSHVAFAKEDGSYSFQGVRPGKYRLLSVDAFHGGNIDKPEDAKKLVEAAEEFEIKEGESITKDVKVVAKEASDAKDKK